MKRLHEAKVLLIDGDPMVRAPLDYHLRRKVDRFCAVDSAEKALAGLMREPWDLVLCDAHLPRLDGVNILRIVAGRWPRVVPLLIVDHLGPEFLTRAVQAGICGFIFKPIRPERMARSLEEALATAAAGGVSGCSGPLSAGGLLEYWAHQEDLSPPLLPAPQTAADGPSDPERPRIAAAGVAPLFAAVNRVRALNQRWVMLGGIRSQVRKRPVRVSEVLQRAALSYGAYCRPSGITVDCRYPKEAADVVLPSNDPVLSHVLHNLFINAVHSLMEKRSADGRIVLSMTRRKEAIRIRIEDNGAGIPPSAVSRVRGLGFSTRANGTGLGLFVVDRLCEQIGAKVDIHSRWGRGTTIAIDLPRAETQPDQPAPCAGAQLPAA